MGSVLVVVDKIQTPRLKRVGESKEITSTVQQLRKKSKLVPTDKVWAFYTLGKNSDLETVIKENHQNMEYQLRCPLLNSSQQPEFSLVYGRTTKQLESGSIDVCLVRPCARLTVQGKKKCGEKASLVDQYLQSKSE